MLSIFKNNNIQKIGSFRKSTNIATRRLVSQIEFEYSVELPKRDFFMIYFIVSNYEILKIGKTSDKKFLQWYTDMTSDMGKGRYIPHFYILELLNSDKKVELYGEIISDSFIEYADVSGQIVKYFSDFSKEREKEYLKKYTTEFGKFPILNRQESSKKIDDFEIKYTELYNEKISNFKLQIAKNGSQM